MNISEVISNIENLNESLTIYAKKDDGKFINTSQAVLLELTEEEKDLNTSAIGDRYCPGFDYFLEVFIAKDIFIDLKNSGNYKSLEEKVNRIIYYAEFDA